MAAFLTTHIPLSRLICSPWSRDPRLRAHKTTQLRTAFDHLQQQLLPAPAEMAIAVSTELTDAIKQAAQSGYVIGLKILLKHPIVRHVPEFYYRSNLCLALANAAAQGHPSTVETLLNDSHLPPPARDRDTAFYIAINHSQLEVISFLRTHVTPDTIRNAFLFASSRGLLDVIRLLLAHATPDTIRGALVVASSSGQLDVVRFPREHAPPDTIRNAFVRASSSAQLAIVLFLLEHVSPARTRNVFVHAAALVPWSIALVIIAALALAAEIVKLAGRLHDQFLDTSIP